ncbi:MAG: hypothetical protein ACP6IY_06875 [Promethearchaeia archaeon]
MTDTQRTTITLTDFYWRKIERLVGKFASTKAQVISKIVENYLDSEAYYNYIKNLEEESKKLGPKEEEIHLKLTNYISWAADGILLESFISDIMEILNVNRKFVLLKMSEWLKEFRLIIKDGKVYREKS